jgi:adenylate cyclase
MATVAAAEAGTAPSQAPAASALEHGGRTGRMAQAEDAGLVFAFRARTIATLTVAAAILVLAPWPRSLVYVGFAGAFLLFGFIPFVLRRHPWAEAVKLIFVALDVMLITAAVLNVPAAMVWIDWPIQTRLRSQNFLLLLLLLGEAALTYSPRRVLWTGAWVAGVWSLAFAALYWLPDSVRYGEIVAQGTDEGLLTLFLSPTYVSLPQWLVQFVSTIILTVLLATAVYRSRTHLDAQVRAEVLRADLARYVSPDVAEALADPSSPDFGRPANRQVAVLFADIVGFTALTERLDPERTFALLRSFQERSSRVVFSHRGTLDKFLGDGLMATFGALQNEQDAAFRAVTCAFALRREMERWNEKRRGRGASTISLSIGVHCGPVFVGNLGWERRIEFTAVGDVVNVASRLEQVTRELGCGIVISNDCFVAAKRLGWLPPFDRVEDIPLRGRLANLRVHVAGCAEGATGALGRT